MIVFCLWKYKQGAAFFPYSRVKTGAAGRFSIADTTLCRPALPLPACVGAQIHTMRLSDSVES